jgi:hypothetical protein
LWRCGAGRDSNRDKQTGVEQDRDEQGNLLGKFARHVSGLGRDLELNESKGSFAAGKALLG